MGLKGSDPERKSDVCRKLTMGEGRDEVI